MSEQLRMAERLKSLAAITKNPADKRILTDAASMLEQVGDSQVSEQVWCITCGQPITVTRLGPKPGPVIGPACPCGKSEGITWEPSQKGRSEHVRTR